MSKPLTVATFDNVGEAEILRQELEDIGVHAWLSNDTITVALWHVGSALGGVKVQIDAEDERIAYKLVTERQRRRDRNIEATEWYCGRCREWISPSFDLCWSCRGPRDEVEKRPPAHVVEDREREIDQSAGDDAKKQAEESAVDRAWRASVVGWAVCPPIILPPLAHFYSSWLLAGLDAKTRSSQQQRKIRNTWISNLTAFGMFILFWVYAFTVLSAEAPDALP